MSLPAPLRGSALGHQYALHALKERRAELAYDLNAIRRRATVIKNTLAHIDCTIRLMAPDLDLASIRLKKPRVHVKLFAHGKLSRLVVDALRRGEKPMTTREIVEGVAGSTPFGPKAARVLRDRVHSTLLYLTKHGKIVKDGAREKARWSLAQNAEAAHIEG